MASDLNITLRRFETSTCDLTDKETECIACQLSDGSECVIAVTQFIAFVRMEQRKKDRMNGAPQTSRKTSPTTAESPK